MTPPHTLVLPDRGDWLVRVVPNLYPALEQQEVVVHSPTHVRSITELDADRFELVAQAWQRRRDDQRSGHVLALVNEGREAGASLPHPHSQLVWLPDAPSPEPPREGQTIDERDGLVWWSPRVARVPYETAIAPVGAEPDGLDSELLPAALRLLAECIRRLRSIEGFVPLNAWLHNHDSGWRIVVFPRLTILAALEIGAGYYVNTLSPEEAADRLANASS